MKLVRLSLAGIALLAVSSVNAQTEQPKETPQKITATPMKAEVKTIDARKKGDTKQIEAKETKQEAVRKEEAIKKD